MVVGLLNARISTLNGVPANLVNRCVCGFATGSTASKAQEVDATLKVHVSVAPLKHRVFGVDEAAGVTLTDPKVTLGILIAEFESVAVATPPLIVTTSPPTQPDGDN